MKLNIYEKITEFICGLLKTGVAPWTKPWKVSRGLPRNLVSKKAYRGINTFLLHACQYESPYWLTYKQATEAGGHVRKGEKSCPVVFWKQLDIKDTETDEAKKIPFMRFYWLFNAAQVEGLAEVPTVDQPPTPATQILAGYQNAPSLKHGMASAFYDPAADEVGMPLPSRFTSEADYFATLFHELTHSTGAKSRLDRLTSTSFGSEAYSKEELVAEMGSAFLCGHAGIERQLETNAAYISGWMKALKSDPKLIVQAAAQAQKAVDHILGIKIEEIPAT